MILVDRSVDYSGMTKLRHKVWSHMVSDQDEDELHAFAKRLGLKRAWAQLRPKASAAHYDIIPAKRDLALQLGAIAVTSRELAARNFDGLTRRRLLGVLWDRGTYR